MLYNICDELWDVKRGGGDKALHDFFVKFYSDTSPPPWNILNYTTGWKGYSSGFIWENVIKP